MTNVLCILNKSYIHGSVKRTAFLDKLEELIGDKQHIWCIAKAVSMETIIYYGYDLSDINPNLSGLTVNKDIRFCYFMLGSNITTIRRYENNPYKTATYRHQDISKLISEGIFIEDNINKRFLSE